MKKFGNINNIPIIQGRNNEIKNQIKAEINIDGTLSFKKKKLIRWINTINIYRCIGK